MPELPDVMVYRDALEARLAGHVLRAVDLPSPFVLRTAVPPLSTAIGREIVQIRRIGKRIVLALQGELFIVLHLMIAGRLLWRPLPEPPRVRGKAPKAIRNLVARFHFDHGQLSFTEAGTRKRASIHLVEGEAALAAIDPGGVEPLETDLAGFAERLGSENHTLKRALTDPRLFSGIGNAYADEILHRARLSPFAPTTRLGPQATERLWQATRETLREWYERLRTEADAAPYGFPEQVTAYHPRMAVHGRFRQPCPDCGAPIQRIVYAENETHYCARCQTRGVILADRSLSRLLKASWPRSIDELG
jgi:formamidopyrimidine-DNA glycosylase